MVVITAFHYDCETIGRLGHKLSSMNDSTASFKHNGSPFKHQLGSSHFIILPFIIYPFNNKTTMCINF